MRKSAVSVRLTREGALQQARQRAMYAFAAARPAGGQRGHAVFKLEQVFEGEKFCGISYKNGKRLSTKSVRHI